jgi:hypothetical protein
LTRSVHREENEQVVEEVRDYVGRDWQLSCVLPEVSSDRHYDYEIGIHFIMTHFLKMNALKLDLLKILATESS